MWAELKESLSEELEREGKKKIKTKHRKRTETSPNGHLTKTRCHPDPRYLRHTESLRRKQSGRNHKQTRKNKSTEHAIISTHCGCLLYIFNKEINAHFECVRWATICRRALMCSLQPPLKFCTSSCNKGNKIRG